MPPKNGMRPVHPGELIADELVELGISADEFDKALGLRSGTVAEIVQGKRNIDAEFSLRIARYLGGGERLWMNLQVTYDLKVAEQKHGAMIAKQVVPRKDHVSELRGDYQ